MEFLFWLLFLGFEFLDLYFASKMQKRLDDVTQKYNDLRVQYASLKSKRGVEDANN